MRKRLLSLALTAGMALTLLPASALAAEPGNVIWLDESIVSYDGLGYYNNAGPCAKPDSNPQANDSSLEESCVCAIPGKP